MTIVLDTTQAYWTAQYYYNDVLVRTVTYDASHPNPAITHIAMLCHKGVACRFTQFIANAPSPDIYQDDFGGLATAALDGQTPVTTQGSNTWEVLNSNGGNPVSGPYLRADGSFTGSSSSVYSVAYLPFAPVAGNIYSLGIQATDISGVSGVNGSLGFGFSGDPALNQPGNLGPWMARNWGSLTGSTYRNTASGSGGNLVGFTATGALAEASMTIVLDTTQTYWTAQYYYGDTMVRTVTYDASHPNPAITHVAVFGQKGAIFRLSQFELY